MLPSTARTASREPAHGDLLAAFMARRNHHGPGNVQLILFPCTSRQYILAPEERWVQDQNSLITRASEKAHASLLQLISARAGNLTWNRNKYFHR